VRQPSQPELMRLLQEAQEVLGELGVFGRREACCCECHGTSNRVKTSRLSMRYDNEVMPGQYRLVDGCDRVSSKSDADPIQPRRHKVRSE
jgi:hypothetical protein